MYPARWLPSVAGANAPAFVERAAKRLKKALDQRVSPELTLRPSLSAAMAWINRRVSPELTLRPSLSVPGPIVGRVIHPCRRS